MDVLPFHWIFFSAYLDNTPGFGSLRMKTVVIIAGVCNHLHKVQSRRVFSSLASNAEKSFLHVFSNSRVELALSPAQPWCPCFPLPRALRKTMEQGSIWHVPCAASQCSMLMHSNAHALTCTCALSLWQP